MSFCLLKYAGMKADFYICGYDKNKLRRIKVILLKFHLEQLLEKSCKIVDVADGTELVRIITDDS